jgi:hypothetical protein
MRDCTRTFQADHPGTKSAYREGNPVEVGFPVGLVEKVVSYDITSLITGNRALAGWQKQSSKNYKEQWYGFHVVTYIFVNINYPANLTKGGKNEYILSKTNEKLTLLQTSYEDVKK